MRTIKVQAKCSDCCFVQYFNSDTEVSKDKDGYVPSGLGFGGGDYIEITIDVDTGMVVGFPILTEEEVLEELS